MEHPKKQKRNTVYIAALFIFISLFISIPVLAILPPHDQVTLFESGKMIKDDKTLWAADYGYGGICENGICQIGQQFYPVTIYRLKNTLIQKFGEYKETIGSKQGMEFNEYLKSNSFYSTQFHPFSSKSDRTLTFDLKTLKINGYPKNNDEKTSLFDKYISYFAIAAILLVLSMFYIIGKKYLINYKKRQKPKTK